MSGLLAAEIIAVLLHFLDDIAVANGRLYTFDSLRLKRLVKPQGCS